MHRIYSNQASSVRGGPQVLAGWYSCSSGINAAINVANDSIAILQDVNITTHNGAANVYSFGTGTVVYINDAWLYSSGPVAHGLYASGNGTIYGTNIEVYSGGNRASGFSGDSPGGYVHVTNGVVHTDGIGSAICYALGLCNITNVIGHASRSPAMFSDGVQTGIWTNCDLTAGLLGGFIQFSSMTKEAGATVTLDHSKLTVLGSTMPAFWFGNVAAEAYIISSQVNNTASGILAVANFSQVTQAFDYYAGYADNSLLSPADGVLYVEDSAVVGDLVAYNGSTLNIDLSNYASWTGTTKIGYGSAEFAVALDSTSTWTLTGNVTLQNFTDTNTNLTNIVSNGFFINYNSSAPANSALDGKTIDLSGGGKCLPIA